MEAEDETLALLDFNWFYLLILSRSQKLPPFPPKDKSPAITADSLTSKPSPDTQTHTPKLQTISSGEVRIKYPLDFAVGESRERRFRRDRYRRGPKRMKNRESKSLSDLEFEELKGFMDLGFTFSDAEASDPWLISILPGLQRLKPVSGSESPAADCSVASETTEEIAVARPYLSEAWEVEEEEEEEEKSRILRNWRTPAEGEGADLKEQLRLWAHAVASAFL